MISLNIDNIFINTDHQIVLSHLFFEPKKHTYPKNLNELRSNSIDAKFYFKEVSRHKGLVKNGHKLVVMEDGSLQLCYYNVSPESVLYKISNTSIKGTDRYQLLDRLEKKITIQEKIQKNIDNEDYKNLTKNVDDLLEKHYRRIPILAPETKPTLQQQLLIITCCIVFLIVVIILCVQCCRSQDESNTEVSSHDKHETNDLNNHYPSSTDLVIEVKDTEPIDNTNTTTYPSVSITSVTTETLQTTSTYLVMSASTTLDIQDPKATELTESETENIHHSYSQEDEENSNEINSADDFTI
jgi:hypothetical protein